MNRIAVMVGLLALALEAVAADPTRVEQARSLAEVRTLDALPKEVNTLLGRDKSGPDGIADSGKPFNMTDVVDPHLPMRRFIRGGSSLQFVLVEYERGGRGHSIHVMAFESQRSGWTQVEQWTLTKDPGSLFGLVDLLFPTRNSLLVRQQIHRLSTMPARREGPLRADNITDEEVREIQGVMASLAPGAIVNISGVVTGCPCEDGGGCTDQVWVVAYRPERSRGLQLSRISGHWSVGPVQQWWLDYARLQTQRPDASDRQAWSDYLAAQEKLEQRYPTCGKPTAANR